MVNVDIMEALAQAIGPYLTGEKATGNPQANYLYSPGGLFGRCDGSKVLVNAMVGPIGVEKYLTWLPTKYEKVFADALKAVVEEGYEQSSSCGDCVRVNVRACAQFFCLGRFCRQTQELSFDRLGLMGHENVPQKTMFGNITDAVGNILLANGQTITNDWWLQVRMVGYALRLRNSIMLWTGNPANNVGTSYMEYPGLQLTINTGKFDAYTQLDCDSIDAFLLNANFNALTSDGTYAVRTWFARMVEQFQRRAEGAGMAWETAKMLIVMSPNQWNCIARVFSCAGVDLCSLTSARNVTQVSADQALARHEDLKRRMVLPVNGVEYPVVLDSQIPETTGQANGICSDIYFLTTEIDGQQILYGVYQDFNQTYGSVRQEFAQMFGGDDIAITDKGRYALVKQNVRGCFDVQAYLKPGIVALAPWLSGRIQNVCCNVLGQPFPDVTGSGRVYELDGGRSTTPVPTLYGPCLDC